MRGSRKRVGAACWYREDMALPLEELEATLPGEAT